MHLCWFARRGWTVDVCKDPLLNSVFDLETWFLTSTETCNRWSFEFSKKVDCMLMSVVERSKGSLKEIRVRHCTDESLLYVADRCPHLEVLWVKHCPNVTDKSMEKIALKCPKIMELDISCSYALSSGCMEMFGKNCKNLQIIKQNFTALSEVSRFESFENYMENLPIIPIGSVDPHAIRCHMQQLKHLELRFLTKTDKALASICKQCPKLEYLDLFGCQNLTMYGVINSTSTLKNLKEIKKPNFRALFF
ncbi:PREDICTED: putative F-box/LRR-repeat protein 19 [Camelina sativa]|uniref:F-box/LRR-repeat protein 19 n=1 Tax=Camelina sativa TaxID=90675 RepID=A0ABM1QGU6_CAMSA|nr:PREDICTED: putative F-box/LRR-repeat protein 19 [Camelina sativa]XP_019085983.1 PREDICTED: putative F-box/LRR-repeat protein 19 [Camelina sativa]XP_019085984.1 PREDICTED: putative F-box/LRR-repeat protein 19 [Camelina sativa]